MLDDLIHTPLNCLPSVHQAPTDFWFCQTKHSSAFKHLEQ